MKRYSATKAQRHKEKCNSSASMQKSLEDNPPQPPFRSTVLTTKSKGDPVTSPLIKGETGGCYAISAFSMAI